MSSSILIYFTTYIFLYEWLMSKVQKYRTVAVIFICWLLDLLTKTWAVEALSDHKVVNVLGDILRFRLAFNTGGVFGIFQGNPMVFHILTGLAIIFLVVYFIKTPEKNNLFIWAISFILGGAFGNFTDRFFYYGVVDFIDMGIGSSRWPTYNFADSCISTGAVLLIIAFYQKEKAAKQEA